MMSVKSVIGHLHPQDFPPDRNSEACRRARVGACEQDRESRTSRTSRTERPA
jgi:hypothetical protein